MVSFSCENCGDVLTKKKLDGHRNQCYGASFTCLDCMVHFPGTSYKSHTACITEDQKYQGKLYKEKKPKGQQQHQKKDNTQFGDSQALTAHDSYAVDAPEAVEAVAIVNAPPRAPTPPPASHSLGYHEQAALPAPNVFDFLDGSATPTVNKSTYQALDESRMLEDSQPPAYTQPPAYEEHQMPSIVDVMKFQVDEDDDTFMQNGYSYGTEAVRPSNERFDSYTTPAPKSKHSRTKSRDTDVETSNKKTTDRKRKRKASPTELDISLVRAQEHRDSLKVETPAGLHSGLTGGLNRLLTQPEFPPSPEDSGDYANSPLSPIKRAKPGTSQALMRAQKDWEKKQSKAEAGKKESTREKDEKKDKDRGRNRDRKERKASTTLVKIRPKKKRDDSGSKEVRRIRRRQYSSSVSPVPQERKAVKAIEYNRSASNSPAPENDGQMIVRPKGELAPNPSSIDARAELFMSFITKGPDSERGMSVNKALKRYHRERFDREDRAPSKADEEKELWKDLRLRRNDRGEIVLFFAADEA